MIPSHWIHSDPEGTGWSFFWTQIRLDEIWTESLIVSKLIFFSAFLLNHNLFWHNKNFVNLKFNWTKKNWATNFVSQQKKVNTTNFANPTIFWGTIYLDWNFCMDPQFFWVNFFCIQIFTQNSFHTTFFGTQFFTQKMWTQTFSYQITTKFRDTQFFGTNIFGTNIFYDPILDQKLWPDQIVFWDKTFLTQENSVPRLRYFDLKCCLDN